MGEDMAVLSVRAPMRHFAAVSGPAHRAFPGLDGQLSAGERLAGIPDERLDADGGTSMMGSATTWPCWLIQVTTGRFQLEYFVRIVLRGVRSWMR